MENQIVDKARAALAELIGLRMLATVDVCGLRCFHLGEWQVFADRRRATYGLQIQCAYRFQSGSRVLVGSGDFTIRADGNTDPAWEVGNPEGHLLEQRIKLLFPLHDSEYGLEVSEAESLRVEDVSVDGFGGFTLALSGGIALVVFPSGSRAEEWALIRPVGRRQFVFPAEE